MEPFALFSRHVAVAGEMDIMFCPVTLYIFYLCNYWLVGCLV